MPTSSQKKVISLTEHPFKANKFYFKFQFSSKSVCIILLKGSVGKNLDTQKIS